MTEKKEIFRIICTIVAMGCLWPLSQLSAEDFTVHGLSASAHIHVDEEGIPHIYAETERDTAFLNGWIHAESRLFQMDVSRRAASGTLAELLGAAVLEQDIQLRTFGLRRAAWETYLKYSGTTRAWLQAYTNGVNARLESLTLPPEYAPLEITQVAPWTIVDSIVVGKILAFQLSFDLDLDPTIRLGAYLQSGQVVGFDGQALFFEDTHRSQPPDGRISVPGFLPGSKMSARSEHAVSLKNKVALDPRAVSMAREYRERISGIGFLYNALNGAERSVGSNLWAVDGSLTENGHPLVANDPHLAINLPATFMEAHLVSQGEGSESINVNGLTIPGVPGVVQGCTTQVCWGSTVHPMDVTDIFFDDLILNTFGLPTHTVHNGVKEPVTWIFQSYFVNTIGDGEMNTIARANVGLDAGGITFIVPRRNNGPIINLNGTTALTVQYTGWRATFELEAFRQFNRSENMGDFEAALQYFDFGSQNFVYGDVAGNIAYFTSGEKPLRDDLQNLMAPDGGIPPYFIRTGNGSLRHEWLPVTHPQTDQALGFEILPFAEMPRLVNPSSGYIANANNDPVGTTLDNNPLNQVREGGGLYYLNPGYASLRMGRVDRVLQDLVSQDVPITMADMKNLQSNNQMLDAQLAVPFILTAGANPLVPTSAEVVEAIERMASWDFSTPTGIQEGYDPNDDPLNLPSPSMSEVANSISATIYSVWRGQIIDLIIDQQLSARGLSDFLPPSSLAWFSVIHMLSNFDVQQGVGASGIDFFNAPAIAGFPAEVRRDILITTALQQALDLLASDEFAPAFGNSQNQDSYRWGKLHRIVLDHPLGGPFSLPNDSGSYGVSNLTESLPGVARSGGFNVVDASTHSARANSLNGFMFGNGPNRRFVADMEPSGLRAEQIIPGGQSGVLGDPLYASQLHRWLTNQYHPMLFSNDDVDNNTEHEDTFTPGN